MLRTPLGGFAGARYISSDACGMDGHMEQERKRRNEMKRRRKREKGRKNIHKRERVKAEADKYPGETTMTYQAADHLLMTASVSC